MKGRKCVAEKFFLHQTFVRQKNIYFNITENLENAKYKKQTRIIKKSGTCVGEERDIIIQQATFAIIS